MARINIEQIRALGDPVTTYNWDLEFITIPAMLTFNSSDINIRCESVGIPKVNGESLSVRIRGLPPVNYPGLYTPDQSWTMNMIETEDRVGSLMIQQWQNACYNFVNGTGLPKAQIEAQIKITQLDKQNNSGMWYLLHGAYIENGQAGDTLQGSAAEIIRPQITFKYDYFEQGK